MATQTGGIMLQRITYISVLCAMAIGIAGCNSTEPTLAPIPGVALPLTLTADAVAPDADAAGSAVAPAVQTDPQFAALAPQSQPPQASTSLTSQPANELRGRIRFTPVIGAPVNAVTPLSRQLAVEARNRGLQILSSGDSGGDHVLKGYFSADTFEGQTTIYFVWDILDLAGTRLLRIQGQETFPGGAGDPWASVPAATMERIATRSIGEYAAWRGF